jgi:hypothetical protein
MAPGPMIAIFAIYTRKNVLRGIYHGE